MACELTEPHELGRGWTSGGHESAEDAHQHETGIGEFVGQVQGPQQVSSLCI